MRVGGRGAIDNKRTLYFNHNTWEKLNQALLFCIEKKKKNITSKRCGTITTHRRVGEVKRDSCYRLVFIVLLQMYKQSLARYLEKPLFQGLKLSSSSFMDLGKSNIESLQKQKSVCVCVCVCVCERDSASSRSCV
jgi:hypothetical protein